MTFKFFGTSSKKTVRRSAAKKVAVKRAADGALVRYDKTFKDLAKYDRGERISIPVSR